MIKRLTWFVGGAIAGITGAGIAKKKVKEKAADLAPTKMARAASQRIRDAISEGKRAMRARESELRARLDGTAESLADNLEEGDAVLVDGTLVEPGKVVVLRQVRDHSATRRRRRT